MIRPSAAFAALLALSLTAIAQPAAAQQPSPLYAEGRTNWLAARYPNAYPPLYDFRRAPYGRTADVDYMLGTSACRIAARRDWGANTLNYILYAYALSAPSRRQVITERDLCRAAAQPPPMSVSARSGLDQLVRAGATARGKLFYMIGQGDAAAAYPARQTRPIPAADLGRRLVPLGRPDAIRAALAPLAPSGARIVPIGRFAFVVGAGQTDAQLQTLANLLDAYVTFLERTYGVAPPDRYLTIYLLPDIPSVQRVADRVHGLNVSPSTLGYTYQDDLSTVAMIRGAQGGTLLHEVFHLVVRANFGDVPQWLDEGVASLYEVSNRNGDTFRGLPNWRGEVLRAFRREAPKLDQLVASPWFSFDRADAAGDARWDQEYSAEAVAAHLATARYFVLYLQDQGLLGKVYQAFQARDPGADADPGLASVRLVETATGRPIATLQSDYDAWLPGALRTDRTNAPGTSGKTIPGKPCANATTQGPC